MKLCRLAVAFALSLPLVALAAPVPKRTAKDAVKHYFENVEKGGAETAWLVAPPAKEVVKELLPYLDRESDRERSLAVGLIAYIGRQSKDKAARRAAVEALLAHAVGKDDGRRKQAEALAGLVRFSKADFPKSAAAEIEKLVRVPDPHNDTVLLAGILEVKSVTDDLKRLAAPVAGQSPFLNPQWSANLALARLGDADAVKHCVAAVEGEPDIVQRVRHFHELVYIRQSAATKSLAGYLNSDERLPDVRQSDLPGSPLAYYALTVLAESVEGFPVKSESGPTYTTEQLAAARKWVSEKKQLKWKE
jgi:hypothetical protein